MLPGFMDYLWFVVLLADPAPPTIVNTDAAIVFLASKIAPIVLAVLGIVILGRATKGDVSKVLTSSAIAVIGLAFLAGAAILFTVGQNVVNLLFR